jgi:peptide/nickel transport system substrate-binding protein
MLLRRIGVALAAAVFAVTGTAVFAPAQEAAAAHAAAPKVLKVALTQDIDSLNPFLAEFSSSTIMGRLMYEFLTTYDPKDEHPVPALATKWTHSADDLTWTYTIRSGAKWSDGQAITAHDVAFTYNLMMTNEAAATANGNFTANFASVTAPDDTTLIIKTKSPQATMLALDIPIVPQHIWQGVDPGKYANTPTPGHPVVGSGPFVLSDYKQGQYVTFSANKTYWRGAPQIDQIQFIHFDSTTSAQAALVKGDVDLMYKLTATQFNSLKNTKNIGVNQAEGPRFVDMLINPGAATSTGQPIGDGNPNLKDVKLRQAIAMAIDQQQLVKGAWGGYAQAGSSYIPPAFKIYHWDVPADQQRKFDIAGANKALDAAGYPKGPDGIRMGKDGKPLNLRLLGNSDEEQDTLEAQYIKGWMQQIGIAVDPQIVASNKLNDATTAGDYDLALSQFGVNPDPDYVLSIQTCAQRPNAQGQGGITESFFCNADYDRLYAQQLAETDQGKRAAEVKQMEQIFYQQVPEVTLVYPNALEAYRSDRWAPFAVQPQPGGVILGQNGYWSFYEAKPLAAASAGSGGGSSTGLIIGIVIAVVVIGGGILIFVSRRRTATTDDRE